MFQKLKHINLLEPRIVSGVEVRVDSLGATEDMFYYSVLKNYYGTISIKKQSNKVLSLEELAKEIGKDKRIPFGPNYPVVLVFTGKQVITKKINGELDFTDESGVLQKVLPGARLNEFYIQSYHLESSHFVSIIKKEIVDQVVSELKEKFFYVQEVLIGSMAVLSQEDELRKNNEIEIPNYTIQFDQGEVSLIKSGIDSGPNVTIGEEEVSFTNIISFSSAIDYFRKFPETTKARIDRVVKEQSEIKFGIYQMALIKLFLFLTVFIVLTNYFLGNNYKKAYEELQEVTAEQKQIYSLYQTKEQELMNRINLLKNTGVYSVGNLSFYADRIGVSLPKSIRLLELKIAPVVKKIKKDERVDTDPTSIILKGVAPESIDLNEWVLHLNTEEWVRETVIINYSQMDRDQPGIFNLEISLNG